MRLFTRLFVFVRAWNLRKQLWTGITRTQKAKKATTRLRGQWWCTLVAPPAFELIPRWESHPLVIFPPAAIMGTWLYSSRKRKEEEDGAGRLNALRQPMHANAYLTVLQALNFAILEPADPWIHDRSNVTETLDFLAISKQKSYKFENINTMK